MVRTKVFRSNRAQAVRLPKAVALPENVREVEIVAVGETRIIIPATKDWDVFFSSEHRADDDFMRERDEGTQERAVLPTEDWTHPPTTPV